MGGSLIFESFQKGGIGGLPITNSSDCSTLEISPLNECFDACLYGNATKC
jgi:hypothetical protein